VVGLEGVTVGTTEGVRELRGGVVDVVTEGLDGVLIVTEEANCNSISSIYTNLHEQLTNCCPSQQRRYGVADMAALKMGLTMKEWWGLRVLP
jgi:hypothetical protein